jgi:hypothetical protein
MVKNMGGADRGIRIAIAVIIGILYFTGVIGGALAVVLGIIAIVFLLTGLVSTCPLYLPMKWSTMRKKGTNA